MNLLYKLCALLSLFPLAAFCHDKEPKEIQPTMTTPAPLKILFGSCSDQNIQEQMWDNLNQEHGDYLILLGDNIYADALKEETFTTEYAKLTGHPDFQKLQQNTKIFATWDDHDYGINDSGADYPLKDASRKAFLDAFGEDPQSPRRTQEGGIYTSYMLGKGDHQIHIILLDTRWNRSPLNRITDPHLSKQRYKRRGLGRNRLNTDPEDTILGKEQWQWLEQQLKIPAEITILVSSIQVLADFNGCEGWSNFPHEKEKLLQLLKENSRFSKSLFMLSGDAHRAEFSRVENILPYPLWDFTASSFTNKSGVVPKNSTRTAVYPFINYGVLEISYQPQLKIDVKIKDKNRHIQLEQIL